MRQVLICLISMLKKVIDLKSEVDKLDIDELFIFPSGLVN